MDSAATDGEMFFSRFTTNYALLLCREALNPWCDSSSNTRSLLSPIKMGVRSLSKLARSRSRLVVEIASSNLSMLSVSVMWNSFRKPLSLLASAAATAF